MRLSFLRLALLIGTVSSCSFDYSGAGLESNPDGRVPSVELHDVSMTIRRSNLVVLSAERIATYPDEGIQEFYGLRFSEYGPNGVVRLEGSADEGWLDLRTEDIELRGTVRFYSQRDQARIESSMLRWDAAERVLYGPDSDSVRVETDAGSVVRGRGMRVEGRSGTLGFENGVDGVYVSPEEP